MQNDGSNENKVQHVTGRASESGSSSGSNALEEAIKGVSNTRQGFTAFGFRSLWFVTTKSKQKSKTSFKLILTFAILFIVFGFTLAWMLYKRYPTLFDNICLTSFRTPSTLIMPELEFKKCGDTNPQ